MYRIDNATAVAALPTPAAVGPNPNGYFTKGNPGGGLPSTLVDDDWLNAIQEELLAVVVAGGLSASKTVRTQVRDAIANMIAAATPSVPAGQVASFALSAAPTGWLKANGAAVSRTTYAALFAALVTTPGFTAQTFTVSIASPGIVTKNAHGFEGGERLRLSTTGALPTGLNTSTDYFVQVIDANTFYLSSTPGGYATLINTTVSQSGTHSYTRSHFGLGDGSTTFNLPDLRGEFIRGYDDGRGVDVAHALGSNQKGSIKSFDAGGTVAIAGDRSASTAVGGVAHNHLGLDYDNSLAAFPNALTSSVAASSAAPSNAADVGYGVDRPRNVALLACIKY